MEYFTYKNQSIAYIKKGIGHPILFLHNGGTSHRIWQFQIDTLAEKHQVFALDLAGYGQSSAATDYSLNAYTQTIANFIATIMPNSPITLVGNCMGSAIALNFARQQPSRVHSLVLINPLTRTTFQQGKLGVTLSLKKYASFWVNPLSQWLSSHSVPNIAISPSIMMQLGQQGRQQALWNNVALRECYQNPHEVSAILGLYHQLNGFALLDDIQLPKDFPPIYTLWGKQNRILSAQAGLQLNKKLRPTVCKTLDDCGHLLMLERPSEVTAIIESACSHQH